MTYLVLGILLWSFMHFMPAVPLSLRARVIGRIGEGPYKGLSGVLIIASIILIVMGWKSLPGDLIYELPDWVDLLCGVLTLAMSILFFAPYMDSNLARLFRHPQLTGIALWSAGHMLASGQVRSLVLFGGIGAWAVIEAALINRRDGAWQKPEAVPYLSDFKLLLAGLGFFMVFVFVHEAAFGTSVLPG